MSKSAKAVCSGAHTKSITRCGLVKAQPNTPKDKSPDLVHTRFFLPAILFSAYFSPVTGNRMISLGHDNVIKTYDDMHGQIKRGGTLKSR